MASLGAPRTLPAAGNILVCYGDASSRWSLLHNFAVLVADLVLSTPRSLGQTSNTNFESLKTMMTRPFVMSSLCETRRNVATGDRRRGFDLPSWIESLRIFRSSDPCSLLLSVLGMLPDLDPGFDMVPNRRMSRFSFTVSRSMPCTSPTNTRHCQTRLCYVRLLFVIARRTDTRHVQG